MLGVDAMKGFSKWKEESSSHNINNNMLLIGMSANASTEDQNEAFEAGMHFFASKPVSVEFLQLLVHTVRSKAPFMKMINKISNEVKMNDVLEDKNMNCHIIRCSADIKNEGERKASILFRNSIIKNSHTAETNICSKIKFWPF